MARVGDGASRSARAPFAIGVASAVAIVALNVFRAATQSVVHDEARAFLMHVTHPWSDVVSHFEDMNHHVLQTYLSKVSVDLLGVSELALRLPSVLGSGLYLASALGLARALLGSGWTGLLAFLVMALDPGVLDHQSAARGYGLGLAFLFLALWQLVEVAQTPGRGPSSRRRLLLAGVAEGLAVSANLGYAIPAAALTAATVIHLVPRAKRPAAALAELAGFVALPAALVLAVVAGPPLSHLERSLLYVGAPTLTAAARSIAGASFPVRGLGPSLGAWTVLVGWVAKAALVLAGLTIPLAALWLLWRARPLCDEDHAQRPFETVRPEVAPGGAIPAGMLVLLPLLLWLANRAADAPYPEARMGLWAPPLIYACALWLARSLARLWVPGRTLQPAAMVVCALALLVDFGSLDATSYSPWEYDRSTRAYVDAIVRLHARTPSARVSVGMTWQLEPAFNFYRVRYGLDWLEPATRDGPLGAHDYYALLGPDRALVGRMDLVELASDPTAGTLLARARRRRSLGSSAP